MKKFLHLCTATTFISTLFILFIIAFLVIPSISPAQGPYTEKAPMPTARLAFGTAIVDGKIYVIGGLRSETEPLAMVEVYDPLTDTWDTNKKPMPTARGSFGCAVIDGKIYAIGGGVIGSYYLPIVEVYDPVTNWWDTTKAPMDLARGALTASTVNGKIYAIGGTKDLGPAFLKGISTVEEYDPVKNSWIGKMDKPTPVWALCSCVLEGKIYSIGGNIEYPGISEVLEVYDPVTDQWDESKAPMPEKIYSHSSSSVNGKIYVFGGWQGSGTPILFNRVYEYNLETDVWTRGTNMPDTIAELSTVTLDEKIYLIGGTGTPHPFTSLNTVYEYDPLLDPLLTGIEDISLELVIPKEFLMHQNYPNPFNPVTRIKYELPQSGKVTLKVYNLIGQEIQTLVDAYKPIGVYEVNWDGKNKHGQQVAGGVYFYILKAGDFVQTRKMLLLQ